jgi:hypothetical protein
LNLAIGFHWYIPELRLFERIGNYFLLGYRHIWGFGLWGYGNNEWTDTWPHKDSIHLHWIACKSWSYSWWGYESFSSILWNHEQKHTKKLDLGCLHYLQTCMFHEFPSSYRFQFYISSSSSFTTGTRQNCLGGSGTFQQYFLNPLLSKSCLSHSKYHLLNCLLRSWICQELIQKLKFRGNVFLLSSSSSVHLLSHSTHCSHFELTDVVLCLEKGNSNAS